MRARSGRVAYVTLPSKVLCDMILPEVGRGKSGTGNSRGVLLAFCSTSFCCRGSRSGEPLKEGLLEISAGPVMLSSGNVTDTDRPGELIILGCILLLA